MLKKLSVQFSRSSKLFLFVTEVSALAFFVVRPPPHATSSKWLLHYGKVRASR